MRGVRAQPPVRDAAGAWARGDADSHMPALPAESWLRLGAEGTYSAEAGIAQAHVGVGQSQRGCGETGEEGLVWVRQRGMERNWFAPGVKAVC